MGIKASFWLKRKPECEISLEEKSKMEGRHKMLIARINKVFDNLANEYFLRGELRRRGFMVGRKNMFYFQV